MRIAFDASAMFGPRTGIGHYCAALLSDLLTQRPGDEFGLFAVTSKTASSEIPGDGLPMRRLGLPARLAVTTWTRLGSPDASRLLGHNDVVHGTNFWVPPVEKGGVVTIHDLAFWLYPEMCTPQIRRYRWIVPKVLSWTSLVLTPSETVKEQVVSELSFDADRVVVTPEGVRGTFKNAAPDPAVARRLGLTGDYIVFAGTQEPRKNLDRLIEAVAAAHEKGFTLLIAGPPGWGSTDLPAVVHKLRLDDRVLFTGYLTDTELGSLMAGARAFVFPSIYEGFGLPPLEAMAAGVPVVAAKAGSLPEVLGDAPFWCDPFDVGSIAAAIDSAIGDEAARNAAVSAGTARAATFTWERTAELTSQAYDKSASM